MALLLQISRTDEDSAEIRNSELLNDTIRDYKKRLTKETGNTDFLKNGFRKLDYKGRFLEEKKKKIER